MNAIRWGCLPCCLTGPISNHSFPAPPGPQRRANKPQTQSTAVALPYTPQMKSANQLPHKSPGFTLTQTAINPIRGVTWPLLDSVCRGQEMLWGATSWANHLRGLPVRCEVPVRFGRVSWDKWPTWKEIAKLMASASASFAFCYLALDARSSLFYLASIFVSTQLQFIDLISGLISGNEEVLEACMLSDKSKVFFEVTLWH